MAKEIIKENHPLNETKVPVVFPILKPCAGCFEKKEEEGFQPLLEGDQKKRRTTKK